MTSKPLTRSSYDFNSDLKGGGDGGVTKEEDEQFSGGSDVPCVTGHETCSCDKAAKKT